MKWIFCWEKLKREEVSWINQVEGEREKKEGRKIGTSERPSPRASFKRSINLSLSLLRTTGAVTVFFGKLFVFSILFVSPVNKSTPLLYPSAYRTSNLFEKSICKNSVQNLLVFQ